MCETIKRSNLALYWFLLNTINKKLKREVKNENQSISSFIHCWLNKRDLCVNRKQNRRWQRTHGYGYTQHTRISMSIDRHAIGFSLCVHTVPYRRSRNKCLAHHKYGLEMLIVHILGIFSSSSLLSLSLSISMRHFHFAISRHRINSSFSFAIFHTLSHSLYRSRSSSVAIFILRFCILWIDNRRLHDDNKLFARKRYDDNDGEDDDEMCNMIQLDDRHFKNHRLCSQYIWLLVLLLCAK